MNTPIAEPPARSVSLTGLFSRIAAPMPAARGAPSSTFARLALPSFYPSYAEAGPSRLEPRNGLALQSVCGSSDSRERGEGDRSQTVSTTDRVTRSRQRDRVLARDLSRAVHRPGAHRAPVANIWLAFSRLVGSSRRASRGAGAPVALGVARRAKPDRPGERARPPRPIGNSRRSIPGIRPTRGSLPKYRVAPRFSMSAASWLPADDSIGRHRRYAPGNAIWQASRRANRGGARAGGRHCRLGIGARGGRGRSSRRARSGRPHDRRPRLRPRCDLSGRAPAACGTDRWSPGPFCPSSRLARNQTPRTFRPGTGSSPA